MTSRPIKAKLEKRSLEEGGIHRLVSQSVSRCLCYSSLNSQPVNKFHEAGNKQSRH